MSNRVALAGLAVVALAVGSVIAWRRGEPESPPQGALSPEPAPRANAHFASDPSAPPIDGYEPIQPFMLEVRAGEWHNRIFKLLESEDGD